MELAERGEPLLMSVKEAAARLDIDANTVYKMVAAGDWEEVVRIGSSVKVPVSYVEDLASGRRRLRRAGRRRGSSDEASVGLDPQKSAAHNAR